MEAILKRKPICFECIMLMFVKVVLSGCDLNDSYLFVLSLYYIFYNVQELTCCTLCNLRVGTNKLSKIIRSIVSSSY